MGNTGVFDRRVAKNAHFANASGQAYHIILIPQDSQRVLAIAFHFLNNLFWTTLIPDVSPAHAKKGFISQAVSIAQVAWWHGSIGFSKGFGHIL